MTVVEKAAQSRVDEIVAKVRQSVTDQGMTLDEAAEYCDMSEHTFKHVLRGYQRPNSVNLFKMIYGMGIAI